MEKILKIVVTESLDTVVLVLDNGEASPYGYFAWGDDDQAIKRAFMIETITGEILGMNCDLAMWQDELDAYDARTIYTAEDGWLI